MDPKLLAIIIAVAKKESGVQARDLSLLERKVEEKLKEFHKRSPILDLPSFAIKDGCLKCTWSSGLVLDFGNIVGPQGPQGTQGVQGPQGVAGKDGTSGKDGINGKDGQTGKDGAAAAAGRDGVDGKQGLTGAVGHPGEPGQDGKQGVPGNDGKAGERGSHGLPGLDGDDGDDGVGVEKAWVDDNYHLTIKLTSGKVIDAGYVRGPSGTSAGKGGRVTGGFTGGGSGSNFYVTGAVYDQDNTLILTMSNGATVRAESPGTLVANSFETVNKNLKSYGFTLNYTNSLLTSIVYTQGATVVTKTLGYIDGTLITITLSGDIPTEIDTVKTLQYSGATLVGATYS